MQYTARVLPPSYVFEAMRAVIAGNTISASAFVISTALVLVDIVIACWFFVRVYKHSVRTGLIARYSAETVS